MVVRTVAILTALFLAQRSDAQGLGTWDLGSEIMISPRSSSPNAVFGGQTSGISQSALALRASTDLVRVGRVHLRYSAQLLPVVLLSNVEKYERLALRDASTLYVLQGTTRSFGVGIVPIGLDLVVDLSQRARLRFGAGAGIAAFSQHVPVAGGRRRNFSAEWDAAFQVNAGRDRWVTLGARWKHISNGLTAYENPGVDNRMLFAGMSWRIRVPR